MSVARFTALGLDVGGTKVAAGLVSFPDGGVTHQKTIPTRAEQGGMVVLRVVAELAEELAAAARKEGNVVQGIGVGICELVSLDGAILSGNCLPWKSEEVRDRLATIAPAVMEADVRAAAQAEALFGAGKPFRIFLYVTVGTGISSCLMLNGVPYLGARGATGTMASSPLSVVCDQCDHLNAHTLEQIASGPALVMHYNQAKAEAVATGHDVLAAAVRGEPHAIAVIRSAGEALGSTLGTLVNVLDPEAIVVGGGLGLSEGPYWESLVHSTRRHIWSDVHRDLPILRAATGRNAGVIGAAAAAWKALARKQERTE